MSQKVEVILEAQNRMSDDLKRVAADVGALTSKFHTFAQSVESESAKTNTSLRRISDTTRTLSAGLTSMRSLAGLATSALAGLGIGFSLAGAVRQVKSVIDELDRLREQSQKIGIAVQDIAGLEFIFRQAGAGAGEMQSAFRALNNITAEALQGNKEALAQFKALGIEVRDFAAKSPLEQFRQLVEVLGKFEDGAQKNATTQKMLGRSYMDLKTILVQTTAELDAQMERQRQLNPVTQKATENADQFNDALGELKEALKGVINTSEFLPQATKWITDFIEHLQLSGGAADDVAQSLRDMGKEEGSIAILIRRAKELQGELNQIAGILPTSERIAQMNRAGSGGDAALARSQARVYSKMFNEAMRDFPIQTGPLDVKGFSGALGSLSSAFGGKKKLVVPPSGDGGGEDDPAKKAEDAYKEFYARLESMQREKNQRTIEGLDRELEAQLRYVESIKASEEEKARFIGLVTEQTRAQQSALRERQANEFKQYMEQEKRTAEETARFQADIARMQSESFALRREEAGRLRSMQDDYTLQSKGLELDRQLEQGRIGSADAERQMLALQNQLLSRKESILSIQIQSLDTSIRELEVEKAKTTDVERRRQLEDEILRLRTSRVNIGLEREEAGNAIKLNAQRGGQLGDAKNPLAQFQNQSRRATNDEEVAYQIGSLGVSQLTHFSDVLRDIALGADNASERFNAFALSVLDDITAMIFKIAILKAVSAGIGFFSGGAGGDPSLVSGNTGTSAATGGVFRGPQQITIADNASGVEAAIPMPDGKTVPVTLSGPVHGGRMGGGLSNFEGEQGPVTIINHYRVSTYGPKDMDQYLRSHGSKAIADLQLANLRGTGTRGSQIRSTVKEIGKRR